jgi:hypothetical protein
VLLLLDALAVFSLATMGPAMAGFERGRGCSSRASSTSKTTGSPVHAWQLNRDAGCSPRPDTRTRRARHQRQRTGQHTQRNTTITTPQASRTKRVAAEQASRISVLEVKNEILETTPETLTAIFPESRADDCFKTLKIYASTVKVGH